MKIGVFDSGFGGIDILKHIVEIMPEYDYVYLGDNARNPYGTKSQSTLEQYAQEATDFLFKQNCQLVLFACNTASTQALRKIQQEFIPTNHPGKNALGVIIPACEEADHSGDSIGVIATESSVESEAFIREIHKINPQAQIIQQACPLLVKLVETGESDEVILDKILQRYLKPLIERGIDTLVLGCTHYGLLEKHITRVLGQLGSDAHIIHEGRVVATRFKDYLERHPEYQLRLSKNGTRVFYATDMSKDFKKLGSEYFGEEIEVEHAKID